jgi:hypothetical protein
MPTRSSWAIPPEPWPADAARWNRFHNSVIARIKTIRAQEGIDGRVTRYETFSTRLPSFTRPRLLPIGRLTPDPDLARDARGRWIRKAS